MMVSKRMTEQEFQVLQARQRGDIIDGNPYGDDEADPGPEATLQSKIRGHSKQMGWPEPLIFPRTPAVKNFLPPGWPDCVIPIPAHILLVETKAGKEKLRKDQELTRLMFLALGHIIHKINSFKGYLDLIEKMTRGE